MNCPYQNKNERTTECGRNRTHRKGESNGVFFAPIRLHRTLKKSKRTVGNPTRTTKVRLRGKHGIGELLLNLLCKNESLDVP